MALADRSTNVPDDDHTADEAADLAEAEDPDANQQRSLPQIFLMFSITSPWGPAAFSTPQDAHRRGPPRPTAVGDPGVMTELKLLFKPPFNSATDSSAQSKHKDSFIVRRTRSASAGCLKKDCNHVPLPMQHWAAAFLATPPDELQKGQHDH
ncbi:hypothetical protein IFM47457_07377 [Aspergillus lentulus]|nr:hypothetical protein IFM47457_07377 [Aspergillus lentulus]